MSERKEETDAIVKFDDWDEAQIVLESMGAVIEQYFYHYKQGGASVTGMSYSGVRHTIQEMSKIGFPVTIDYCEVMDAGDSFRAKAVARNMVTGICYPGFSEVDKNFESGKKNRFAYTTAGSKAERNALRKHIPETAIVEQYKIWRKSHPEAPEMKELGRSQAEEKVKQEPEQHGANPGQKTSPTKQTTGTGTPQNASTPVSASPDVKKIIDSLEWKTTAKEPDHEFAFASKQVGHVFPELQPLIAAIGKDKLVLVEDGVSFAYTYDAKAERIYRAPFSQLEAH